MTTAGPLHNIDRLPGWRRLLDAMIDQGVEPGAFFPDDWIDEQLGLAKPQTVEKYERYKLQRLRGLTRAEQELEKRGLRTLHRDPERKGFSVPTAQEQFEHAMAQYIDRVRSEQARAVRLLATTDRAQLTDGQRGKLDDATTKLGDQRAFFRRQTFDIRRLLPSPKPADKE
jgi:hypothetical protein